MHVQSIRLDYFRNYARLELNLPARVHVFRGDNAQGKTNLLEAIYYAATTRSRLASQNRELVGWSAIEEVLPHAEIVLVYVRSGLEHELCITLMLDGDTPDSALVKRQVLVDGVRRRAMDVVGLLNVVLFLPEDISLVAGAPSERRRFLDTLLCQVDRSYCRALARYNRALAQRNALLKRIREHQARSAELAFWDQEIISHGAAVLRGRLEAVVALSEYARVIQPELTGGGEKLDITYDATIADENGALPSDSIEELYRLALNRSQREELGRGVTIVGPHRDDIRLLINGYDVVTFGSRGQQRTVALSLKLAEIDLMKNRTGESPVLLLDDVVSELDARRCGYLLDRVSQHEQVLLTTTDLSFFSPQFLEKAMLWEVQAGTIQPG